MNEKERNKIIRQRVAAARPKLTAPQIASERKASMRRLRITEIVATAGLVGVLTYVQFLFPSMAAPSAPSEALFNTFMIYWGVYVLYLAFMIRSMFVRYNYDYQQVSDDPKDNPFRGLRLTLFSPLIPLLLLVPSLISGVFVDSATNNADIIGISLFVLLLGTIGSPLVTVFIVLPIEMLVRGIIALARRDTSRTHYLWIALFVGGLTAFIVFGSLGAAGDSPYPAGSYQVLMALLGLPGSYEVKSEFFLWLARAVALLYAVLIGYALFSRKPEQKNTAS